MKTTVILLSVLAHLASASEAATGLDSEGVRGDLHFHLHARGQNKDGTRPVYKDPMAPIEDRIDDLLPRMTVQEKVSQLWVPAFRIEFDLA